MNTQNKAKESLLSTLTTLCEDLAWGRSANEDQLFALTEQGVAPEPLVQLAEAFGMMLVKVESRNLQSEQLISELKAQNMELEAARQILAERNTLLLSTVREIYSPKRVIGQCKGMLDVLNLAMAIARRPINTLLLGPTGAGKEVVAKLIHFNSPRHEGPFIAVNCTAIPDSLFESEMFGIEKGVATGVSSRRGLVEEAHKGTLFLDELADMTLPNQAKLLRVLETREVMRVGSSKPVPVDIKIIAATNVCLDEAVASKRFREDLYYRISVAEIRIPPLCERGDDILLLAQLFLDRHSSQMGRVRFSLSPAVQTMLLGYSWPGNVRELNNEMERAVALTVGDTIEPKDLSPRILNDTKNRLALEKRPAVLAAGHERSTHALHELSGDAAHSLSEDAHHELLGGAAHSLAQAGQLEAKSEQNSFSLQELERELIYRALVQTEGNRSRAAILLGITREGLRKKLLRIGYAEKEHEPSD